MGTKEDVIRQRIVEVFGSVPKMASATGLAPTTIYHALERGIENTTTQTKTKILEALYGTPPYGYYAVDFPKDAASEELRRDMRELCDIYEALDGRDRAVLLSTARALSRK